MDALLSSDNREGKGNDNLSTGSLTNITSAPLSYHDTNRLSPTSWVSAAARPWTPKPNVPLPKIAPPTSLAVQRPAAAPAETPAFPTAARADSVLTHDTNEDPASAITGPAAATAPPLPNTAMMSPATIKPAEMMTPAASPLLSAVPTFT